MTSKARQKVDPNTRDLFDKETDKPEHDQVLIALFQDESALVELLTQFHHACPLKPFSDASNFELIVSGFGRSQSSGRIGLKEAISKTGVTPRWETTAPIRIRSKTMEAPLTWSAENGRYSRIIGFIDILVGYSIVAAPSVHQYDDGRCTWLNNSEHHFALIEVKGTWPTVGTLLRQLNLYREPYRYSPNGAPAFIVVGPDDSMNEVLSEHKYRLATFDATGTQFTLVDSTSKAGSNHDKNGVF